MSSNIILLKINDAMKELCLKKIPITPANIAKLSGIGIEIIRRNWNKFEVPEKYINLWLQKPAGLDKKINLRLAATLCFPIGKHKNKTLASVVECDFKYCEWILKQEWFDKKYQRLCKPLQEIVEIERQKKFRIYGITSEEKIIGEPYQMNEKEKKLSERYAKSLV